MDKKKFKNFQSEQKHSLGPVSNNAELTMDILFNAMDLTDEQQLVLESKLKKEKKSTFLEKNPEMYSGKYYAISKVLKEKATTLQKYEQI